MQLKTRPLPAGSVINLDIPSDWYVGPLPVLIVGIVTPCASRGETPRSDDSRFAKVALSFRDMWRVEGMRFECEFACAGFGRLLCDLASCRGATGLPFPIGVRPFTTRTETVTADASSVFSARAERRDIWHNRTRQALRPACPDRDLVRASSAGWALLTALLLIRDGERCQPYLLLTAVPGVRGRCQRLTFVVLQVVKAQQAIAVVDGDDDDFAGATAEDNAIRTLEDFAVRHRFDFRDEASGIGKDRQ